LTRRHVLQAIVNSVYFRSREHSITMRERWAAFLATRYADDAALQTAWVDPDAQLPAPKYNRDYLDEHAQTKTDFAEFIQHTNHEILTHFQNAAG
ncbi:MAG: hypothetical protein GY832_26795, partial [Chloroflexi bacterium]|nr:hypothetical protein [Chloroflexota bacterium]